MELQQYLRIFRRYWRSIVAVVLLCVMAAAAFTLMQKPTYTSEASVFIAVESGDTAGELYQGATYAERQVRSFVTVAIKDIVLEPAISQLGLEMTVGEFAQHLTVSSPASTTIITVQAADHDAGLASEMANAVAYSLQDAVEQLAPGGADGAGLVSARVIEQATPSAVPAIPRPTVNISLGVVVGLLLGLGQALLRSLLDTRVRRVEDLNGIVQAPVLASIGHIDVAAERSADSTDQQWAVGEAYRRLRTNVGFLGLGGERRHSITITSSVGAEGKTETAINLTRVLAQAGDHVLLVDADLRKPQVADRMRIDAHLGLSDALSGRALLQDLVIRMGPGGPDVLPSGTIPPNPSELLGSEAMIRLIETLEGQYDHVIFDSPPLLPVADGVILASRTGGAIVVTRAGFTRKVDLQASVAALDAGEVDLLGIVINDVAGEGADGHGPYSAYRRSQAKSH